MRRMSLLLLLLVLAVPALAADPAPLTILEPYGPGSVTDRIIEMLKPGLEKATGQPVAVAREPTAGADAALARLGTAPPDGNTLLVIDLLSVEVAGRDKLSGLTPVAKLTGPGSLSLVVAAASPIKNWADFAAAARAKSLTIASPGQVGGIPLGMMERALGVHFATVPATSRQAMLAALGTGKADAGFLITSTFFPGGGSPPPAEVRPVVSFGAQRNPQLKELPTFSESIGKQPAEKRHNSITSVVALFGPANLPPATVKRLDEAFALAAKSALANAAKPGGIALAVGDAALLKETMARDARVIKELPNLGGQ